MNIQPISALYAELCVLAGADEQLRRDLWQSLEKYDICYAACVNQDIVHDKAFYDTRTPCKTAGAQPAKQQCSGRKTQIWRYCPE